MAVTKLPTPRWWNRGSSEPTPVQSTVVPLVKSTDATPVATPPATTGATDPSPPPSAPRQFAPETVPETIPETTRDFAPEIVLYSAPLTIVTNGGSARVANGLGYRERTNEDFAREFLCWIVREHPGIAGLKIAAYDIEAHFLPRFQASTGCLHLALGALLRGLSNVTDKSPSYGGKTERRNDQACVDYRFARSLIHCSTPARSRPNRSGVSLILEPSRRMWKWLRASASTRS